MKPKSYIEQYDHYIPLIYLVLMIIGLYMQLNISAIRTKMDFFYRQSIWFGLSFFLIWFAFKVINLKKIRKYSILFVIITIILLAAVLIVGRDVKGAVRSIRIWKINIQPSLLARLVLILYFAHILDKHKRVLGKTTPKFFLKKFSALIIIPAIIFVLILVERHFSTLIISGFTLLSILFLAKIRMSTLLSILGIMLIIGIMIISFGPKYRSQRIKIFKKYSLFYKDAKENNIEVTNDYQIKESLISLSAGKFFGTHQEATGKHYFLPEAKTDYIYAIIGEEFGFLGTLVILSLYCFLFFRAMKSSFIQEDFFLKLFGFGLSMNIFYNAIVNIGVAMAALPSTGVTLPFISYGGTSLLVNSFSIGLLMNISAKRRIL